MSTVMEQALRREFGTEPIAPPPALLRECFELQLVCLEATLVEKWRESSYAPSAVLRAIKTYDVPLEWGCERAAEHLEMLAEPYPATIETIKTAMAAAACEVDYLSMKSVHDEAVETMQHLLRDASFLRRTAKGIVPQAGEISDDMILAARAVPITNFIEVGQNGKACCPYHGEKTPSMHLYETPEGGGRLHCFGCGKTVNSIDYVMEDLGMTFKEAVRHLTSGEYLAATPPKD